MLFRSDRKMIIVLKWLLLGFENLSGLKINFDKSEMVPLNIGEDQGQALANLLGCKLVNLPIMYLGVPLHWKKLNEVEWLPLIEKIEKRLQTWKGKLMSMGGEVTLLNSVVSAIPLYWLSLYKMPSKVRYKIDRIRRKFLWFGGNTVRKKPSLIAWDKVCKSKCQGGLGVLDLHRMNTSLLAKWLFRFYDNKEDRKSTRLNSSHAQ